MEFIGRKEYLDKLKDAIATKGFFATLIYGRRRVGKSELIKELIRKTKIKSIYYECKQVSEANNASSLANIFSETFNYPKLDYNTMESILDYIFSYSIKNNLTLVLDEYPYLRETIKGIDSVLQSLIDKYKNKSKLKIVLLGSYVDVMKSLLEHSNPLYGRIDLTIDLKPMDYYESSLFYKNFTPEDKVRIYSVFGGIPYYNSLINDKITVKENIINLIASQGSRLENEVSMYLNAEISKIINANEVFEALAKGYSRYNDILSQSHVTSGPTLVDTLNKLIKMEVVTKVSPINDSNNKKKVGYYISDNLSLFYYRYIFKYLSQMKIMDPNDFYSKYIEKDFEEFYVPSQFEDISKQYLINLNKAGKIKPPFNDIGKYYYDKPKEHKNGEFDIVTKNDKGYVFYEVKFKKNPIKKSIIKEEIEQVSKTGFICNKYVFISRSKIEKTDIDNIEIIYLKDLYA